MSVYKCFVFRFSDVEVHEGELRVTHADHALEIEPKAFRVLVYLVRHAGHLVTKGELMEAVWGETAVTENSLTRAVAVLRRALKDDPRQPRFIETVSTAGYRFICPVVSEEPPRASGEEASRTAEAMPATETSKAVAPPAALQAESPYRLRRLRLPLVATISVVACAGALLYWYDGRPLSTLHISDVTQLTNDPRYAVKYVVGVDGSGILLGLAAPAPGEVPVSGGEITSFSLNFPNSDSLPGGLLAFNALSPDGSNLLFLGHTNPGDQLSDIWVVGSSGSPARFLARGLDPAWSADGKQVIYTTQKGQIFTIPSGGGEPHLLCTLNGPDEATSFVYSPDGTRIRFDWGNRKIMEMASDGSNLHEFLADWHAADVRCCGTWSPDGSFFLFLAGSSFVRRDTPALEIWAVDERRGWLRKRSKEPVQLTFGPTDWFEGLHFTQDRNKIIASGLTIRGELVRYNRQTRRLEPFLGGISADMVDFSRDGKFVVYAPYPGNSLIRANRDGTNVQQVLNGPDHPVNARWSPDDSQIAFVYLNQAGPSKAYVVSSQGGTPVRVLPDNTCCNEGDPTWSPDGRQLALSVESPDGKTDSELRIVNRATHQISYLPRAPVRAWSPRWSPDGRYIVCLTNLYPNTDGLEIYDFKTTKWRVLLSGAAGAGWPSWYRDGRWIYYRALKKTDEDGATIFRISTDGFRAEQIADFPHFNDAGWLWSWNGLDPDDNPLMLRDAGMNEIYALTLRR